MVIGFHDMAKLLLHCRRIETLQLMGFNTVLFKNDPGMIYIDGLTDHQTT